MQWEEVAAVLSLSLTGMLLLATLGWLRRMRRDAAAGYLLALLSLSGLQALEYLYHQQQWFLQWPHLLKLADAPSTEPNRFWLDPDFKRLVRLGQPKPVIFLKVSCVT